MTALLVALAVLQTAPAPTPTAPAVGGSTPPVAAAPAAPAPVETPPSPEDTLQGLQQVYTSTCNQTGILYHAYDDLCDSLRRQIHAYEVQMDRRAAAAKAAPHAAGVPKS